MVFTLNGNSKENGTRTIEKNPCASFFYQYTPLKLFCNNSEDSKYFIPRNGSGLNVAGGSSGGNTQVAGGSSGGSTQVVGGGSGTKVAGGSSGGSTQVAGGSSGDQ